jgi:hypothetical protein
VDLLEEAGAKYEMTSAPAAQLVTNGARRDTSTCRNLGDALQYPGFLVGVEADGGLSSCGTSVRRVPSANRARVTIEPLTTRAWQAA